MSNLLSRTPFGPMSLYPICIAESLKAISRRSSRWQVLEAFLLSSEGRAERVFEGSSGLVILMAIPGQPGSGAFYIYDEIHRAFSMVNFADQDTFHSSMFDYVVQFYDLGRFVELPKLTLVPKPILQAAGSGSGIVVRVNRVNSNSNRRRSNRYRGPRVPQAVVNAAGRTHMGLVTA
jgi:hypothetical protein